MSMPVSVFYKVCLGNFVYLIWFNGPWLQRPIDTTYKSAKSPGVRSNEVRLYLPMSALWPDGPGIHRFQMVLCLTSTNWQLIE